MCDNTVIVQKAAAGLKIRWHKVGLPISTPIRVCRGKWCEEWVYLPALHDWHNPETGGLLAGYLPTPQILFLLGQHIDTDLQ